MRLILIGTEYVGKTTLANALQEWGLKVGKRFHMDDGDFTIPDYHHLNEEDQQTMWNMSAVLKERFQRMVIYYHLEILERYNDCIFGGFHIEEKIFGPRYYHPGSEVSYHRWLEHKMPDNSILVLMTCDPDVVRQRMVDDPHPYELVKSHEIEEIMDEFPLRVQQLLLPPESRVRHDQPDPRRHTRTVPGSRPPPSGRPRPHLPRFPAEVGWDWHTEE